jgi:hypothetical protein
MALNTPQGTTAITALELVGDIIVEAGYGTYASNLFLTRDPGTVTSGLVTIVQEGDGIPLSTFGRDVALESNSVTIVVYGDPEDYDTPRTRARTLRYLVAAQGPYTSRGVTMTAAVPRGGALPLGRDALSRELFSVTLDILWEPAP